MLPILLSYEGPQLSSAVAIHAAMRHGGVVGSLGTHISSTSLRDCDRVGSKRLSLACDAQKKSIARDLLDSYRIGVVKRNVFYLSLYVINCIVELCQFGFILHMIISFVLRFYCCSFSRF